MDLKKIMEENIKIDEIYNSKTICFRSVPILNGTINISMIDNKKKQIYHEKIFYDENDCLYNLKSITGMNNTFITYKGGYDFYNFNSLNNKIIFMSPFLKIHTNINIFTTLISCKIIKNNMYSRRHIYEKKILEKINLNSNTNIFYSDYFNFFVQNNLIENIYDFHNKVKNFNNVYLFIKILKLDIKLNFSLLLMLRYNEVIDLEITDIYDFFYENINLFVTNNVNTLLINDFCKKIIITHGDFDKILLSWFKYIDLSENLIYLTNICTCIDNFTDSELIGQKINKDKLINKYIDYDKCINKIIMFKNLFN